MKHRGPRGSKASFLAAAAVLLVLAGCSREPRRGAGLADEAMVEGGARASVDHVRSELRRLPEGLGPAFAARLDAAPADGFSIEGASLRPKLSSGGAVVRLPRDGRGAFSVADVKSGLRVEVALEGASAPPAEPAGGVVVYRAALPGGVDVFHRPSASGTEDYLRFPSAPARAAVGYSVGLGDGVAGLRLVERTLEVLDAGGAPRLRMEAPALVDAEGREHEPRVSVEGCAVDRDTRPPWGREPMPPGARSCRVRVGWEEASVTYPAVLDPAWTTTGSMAATHVFHTATVLGDGRVLVTGGIGNGVSPINSVDLYDPTTGTWAALGALNNKLRQHTATLLPSGRVLIAGGAGPSAPPTVNTEIYDATGTGNAVGAASMAQGRAGHAAVAIGGKVLVVGGLSQLTPPVAMSSVELYDPAVNQWTTVASLSVPRGDFTATVLADGRVLAAGGGSATAEVYDATTKGWTPTQPLSIAHTDHTATLLPSGDVLLAGGDDTGTVLNAVVEVFHPAANAWTTRASMITPRSRHTASILPNGRILVAGSNDGTTSLTSAEVYDIASDAWLPAGNMATPRGVQTASTLADGTILIAGGANTLFPLSSAELFKLVGLGQACDGTGQCASGTCADGVCCTTACAGVCEACSAAKTGGADGTCAPVKAGTDPDAECPDLGPSTCATTGTCNGARACSIYPSGTACGTASCSAGLGTAPTCDGAGTCQPHVTSCGQYVCAGSACGTTCSSDAGCVAGAYCRIADHSCQPRGAAGVICAADDQCVSSHCADGRCCETACDGLCEACSAAKTGGADGTCAPVKEGTDPDSECAADAASTCQRDGTCDGHRACRLYQQGVSCGPSACSGDVVKGAICDGLGACALSSTGKDCAPYACRGGGCANPCSSQADCVAGYFCDGGACKEQGDLGDACQAGVECGSGFCVEKVCCDSKCDGVCQSCTAAGKGAGLDGACGDAADGQDPHGDCADEGAPSCGTDGSCDGNKACRRYKQGVPCAPLGCDGNTAVSFECNGAGTCVLAPKTAACGDYLCLEGACSEACQTSADCSPTAYCKASACLPKVGGGGEPCQSAEECQSGFCADGFCCNTACTGQCEACDAAGAEGFCVPLAGPPHEGRPACGTGDGATCSAEICDGLERASCKGFVGSKVACRAGACEKGVATVEAHCDGLGACPPADATDAIECAPYVCGEGKCKETCDATSDCATGYQCIGHACVPGSTCDGDHTVTGFDGGKVSCSPFRCDTVNGVCKTTCASVDDCVAGLVCSPENRCVLPGDAEAPGGCSVSAGAPGSGPRAGWLSVGLLGAVWLARRRARAAMAAAMAAASAMIVGCAKEAPPEGRTGEAVPSSPAPSDEARPSARAAIESVRARLAPDEAASPDPAAALQPGLAVALEHQGDGLSPRLPPRSLRAPSRAARLSLPARADGAFHLEDPESGVALDATLAGAAAVPAELTEGLVVYPGALPAGASLIHRAHETGTEDLVVFTRPPHSRALRYDVALGGPVAGLRLVGRSLELLDAAGDPRLRMAPPYWIDAAGAAHPASVALEGCAADADPRAPWGRPVVAPGASRCAVIVGFDGREEPVLVDPAWTNTGQMATARGAHSGTILQSGLVLMAGGSVNTGSTSSAELYNPATRTFAATGSLTAPRTAHTDTRLADGRVLVTGGNLGVKNTQIASAEIYSPATGAWAAVASMALPRDSHTASLLSGARVIVVGGQGFGTATAATEIFDVAANEWSAGPSLPVEREHHTATPLPSGKILIAGGGTATLPLLTASLYDPASNTWGSAASLPRIRVYHTATPLASGLILFAAGFDTSTSDVDTTDLYDPVADAWTTGPNLAVARATHVAALLPTGEILVASGGTAATEVVDAAHSAFRTASPMVIARGIATGSLLADGSFLVAGGQTGAGFEASAELFARAATGAGCGYDADCASGHCADGVCCQSACAGACSACAKAKTGVADGTCAFIPAGADPDDECPALAQSTCLGDGSCDGAGACRRYPAGTSCGAETCAADVHTLPRCDGLGACLPQVGNCAPYRCLDGVTCETTCGDDTGCQPGAYCRPSDHTCQPDLPDGAACSEAGACQSGHCVDGVCCESACNGVCQACSKSRTEAPDGTCAPVTAGTDPDDECPTDAASSCGHDGVCNGKGACRLYAQGSACGATQCNGNLVTGQVCDGLGSCGLSASGVACAPYQCAGDACASPCAGDAQCVAGFSCQAGACVAQGGLGASCTIASQCLLGFCVEGVCCDTACDGPCQACLGKHKASGADGTCAAAAAGEDPHGDCPDDGAPSCRRDGTCDGHGACKNYGAGQVCGPSDCVGGVPGNYTCEGVGSCVFSPMQGCALYACEAGACKTSCASESDCDASAYCDAAGTCQPKLASGHCSTGAECATGLCADGYCCNAPCQGQCEACDLAGSEGTCRPTSGPPHGPRAACDPGSDGACSARTCDGVERSSCAAFVGAEMTCRAAGCEDGRALPAATCTGNGVCPAVAEGDGHDCSPFACVAGVCVTGSCESSADCGSGYHCEAGTHTCLSGACDGDHTVFDDQGHTKDCSPNKCQDDATCRGSCDSVDDCAFPNVCSPNHRCAAPVTAGAASASGCSVAAGERSASGAWSLVALVGLLTASSRRSSGRGGRGPRARRGRRRPCRAGSRR